jgi:hypothetical protein
VTDACASSRTSVDKYTSCARKNYAKAEAKVSSIKEKALLNSGVDPAINGCDNDNCDFVGRYINPAINMLSGAFGIIVVISLILGGIQYTTSAGDPQKVAQAKKRIINTVVALVAFFFLFGFLQFLIPGGLFG